MTTHYYQWPPESLRPVQTVPISPPNKAKTVRKLSNGDLEVTQYSGHVFVIPKDEPLLQMWVIYTMIHDL